MPRGAVPGWAPRGPVEGDTPEERARFECARQGIAFEPTPEQMETVARLIIAGRGGAAAQGRSGCGVTAPKISRRVAVEARFGSIDEALAFVHEQLAALALPEPSVSITPMITEGASFRRVHFIAVVKGTEPAPTTPRCEASFDLGNGRQARCYLDAHPSGVEHRCGSEHALSMDWAWSDEHPVPKLVRRREDRP